jgi:hypothetical protein
MKSTLILFIAGLLSLSAVQAAEQGDEIILYRSPEQNPDNCLLDESCLQEMTQILNEESETKSYENYLSSDLTFVEGDELVPGNKGGQRNLRGNRQLWTCYQCRIIYGYYTCQLLRVCGKDDIRKLAANGSEEEDIEDIMKDKCWVEKRIEYKNALQMRLMERASDPKKFSVEAMVMVYDCDKAAKRAKRAEANKWWEWDISDNGKKQDTKGKFRDWKKKYDKDGDE